MFVFALWDDWVKPAAQAAGNVLLSVMTLGLSSLRDDLYLAAARGVYDRSGTFLFYLITAAALGITIGLSIVGWRRPTPIEEKESDRSFLRKIRFHSILWVPLSLGLLYSSVRMDFTSQAAVTATQFQVIVAPFVDEGQLREWQSRIAQSSTRAEFLAVIEEMQAVGHANNAAFPKVIWF